MMLKIFTLAAVVAVCASATTGPTTTSTEAPDVREPDVDVVAEAMTLMTTECATEIGACMKDASCGALLQTVQAEERLPTTAEVAAAGFQAGMLFQCYMAAESASANPPTNPPTTTTEGPDVVAEAMTLMMTACATEIGACATDASCGALLQTVQAEERLPTTAEVAAAGFQAGMLFQCYMAAESASENPPPATSAPVATPTAPPVAAPTAPPVAAPTAPPAGSGDDASSAAVTTASCAVAAATAAAMFL